MIIIKNKKDCCGCTACYNACPKKCITMKPDEEGFLYPVVDKDTCVECGICEKVCPISSGYKKQDIKAAFIVRNKDNITLANSTSGGAFSAFANTVLEERGNVVGVAFDDGYRVVHKMLEFPDRDVSIFSGSKYVQSDLGQTYKKVQTALVEKKTVLFSGTSCQVAGLNNFLRHDYENLITVEVICHGTPSPKLWSDYLNYQRQQYKSDIKSLTFRNKTYGYHSGTMKIVFENGRVYYGSNRVDLMLKSFFSEISSRQSCYECFCKGLERPADISVYDCWNYEKISGKADDDKGYTNVLVNSDKGLAFIIKCSPYLESVAADPKRAIDLDGVMICNYPEKNANRGSFYEALEQSGIEKVVEKYITITRKDHIVEKAKAISYKLGFFKMLKKLRR